MAFLQFVAQNHDVLWLFCGLIIFTAVGVGVKYHSDSERLGHEVEGLADLIGAMPANATRSEMGRSIDECPFGGTYLADRFKAWTISLIRNGDGESGPRYFSTISPSNALDLDAVASQVINFRQVQAMPNILIGMGLFFTFLGLTAALMFATQGATSGDVSAAQQSLRGLLDAATFKFTTSLVGLASSIVFGLFEKRQHKALETAFDKLLAILRQRFPFISPQQLLEGQTRTSAIKRAARLSMAESLDVLNNSFDNPVGLALIRQDIARTREEAEEQTALLKTFNTDLAASITKAINESLTPQLTTTFDRLQERIDQIGQHLNSTNAEALKTIITEFNDQFQAQARSSFDQMVSAVSSLTTNIAVHSERFAQSFEGVQSVVAAMRDEGGRALDGVRQTVEQLNVSVTRLEGLSELLQNAAEPLSRASESASSVMERVYETQTAATEMVNRLGSVADGFKGIDGDLTAAFTSMHSGFERVVGDLRKFVTELDASFSTSLGGVHDVTEKLDSGLEGLSEGLEAFAVSAKAFQDTMDRMEAALQSRFSEEPHANGTSSAPLAAN